MQESKQVQMRSVDMVWSDRRPGYTGRLEEQGYAVELGPGNIWIDAYHHVGRDVITDAPKQVVIEAMMDATLTQMYYYDDDPEDPIEKAALKEMHEAMQREIPE